MYTLNTRIPSLKSKKNNCFTKFNHEAIGQTMRECSSHNFIQVRNGLRWKLAKNEIIYWEQESRVRKPLIEDAQHAFLQLTIAQRTVKANMDYQDQCTMWT